jgi:F-type H+-transporting ATPase subunit alpha
VGGSAQTKIMKKVAGTLKLSLANYREMEAFAQFASDLDESTQQVLSRGERMVEMLKQPVNSPIPFEQQVVLIYAGIKGYLDTLAIDQIGLFETTLYDKLATSYSDLTSAIVSEKKLNDSIEADMKKVIEEVIDEVV